MKNSVVDGSVKKKETRMSPTPTVLTIQKKAAMAVEIRGPTQAITSTIRSEIVSVSVADALVLRFP